MASPFFRFKQFTVWHDRCAMKVGTDGVLLGAWCPLSLSPKESSPYRLLDIGTGSGLIALILAQRLIHHSELTIDAIDIDQSAVEQAMYNFQQSPWSSTLHAHHSTLQNWQGDEYDLIVSNPPYFQDSLKNPDAQRAAARHTDTLSYAELIAHAARLLSSSGTLALVLPIEAETEIMELAQHHKLYPTHITHVHSKPGKPAKRILIALSPTSNNQSPIVTTFYIESEDSPRSEEYQTLTQDFYL